MDRDNFTYYLWLIGPFKKHFKVEVNSVKNTTMNVWLNDGVYWQWKTTHFGLWQPSSGFDSFLAIRGIYNMHKPRVDAEISSSL
jgi:hypothetical protein